MQDHFDCLTYPRYKILGMISDKSGFFFAINLYTPWSLINGEGGYFGQKLYNYI